jgi:hypothetical protein
LCESEETVSRVEIKVKGHVDKNWSDWFGGFEITHDAGGSTLAGPVRDLVELRGMLSRVSDLGLELTSINTLSGQHTSGTCKRG